MAVAAGGVANRRSSVRVAVDTIDHCAVSIPWSVWRGSILGDINKFSTGPFGRTLFNIVIIARSYFDNLITNP